jgi:DNA-binding transcriptional regulator YiaG
MESMFEYASCGLPGIFLRNGFAVSETPYGEAVAIHDIEGLHRVIGLNIVCKKATLSPLEVRFLRKELDLSQAHFAKILGVGESTVRNWESSGKKRAIISGPADRMLRALYREAVEGDGRIRDMLEHISDLNHDAYKDHLELEDTGEGWKEAA